MDDIALRILGITEKEVSVSRKYKPEHQELEDEIKNLVTKVIKGKIDLRPYVFALAEEEGYKFYDRETKRRGKVERSFGWRFKRYEITSFKYS